MTYIARITCLLGWIGLIIVAPGMLDGGWPIGQACAAAAVSAGLALWGGRRCGIFWG